MESDANGFVERDGEIVEPPRGLGPFAHPFGAPWRLLVAEAHPHRQRGLELDGRGGLVVDVVSEHGMVDLVVVVQWRWGGMHVR